MSDLCCEPVAAVWAPNRPNLPRPALGYLTPAAFAGTFTATSDRLRNQRSSSADRPLYRRRSCANLNPELVRFPLDERRGPQQIGNFCSSCAAPVPDFASPKLALSSRWTKTYLAELSVHRSSRPICTIANGQMCGGGVVTSSAAWQPKSALSRSSRGTVTSPSRRFPRLYRSSDRPTKAEKTKIRASPSPS